MKTKRRSITVQLIQNEQVHNARLVEYFANRIKERGVEYGTTNNR